MQCIREWVLRNFPDASIESKVYAGQIRFSVPTKGLLASKDGEISGGSGISSLFAALEKNKSDLQIEYYSVSRATLDQVFLNIVTKHNVEEEGGEAIVAPKVSLIKELSRVSSRFINK